MTETIARYSIEDFVNSTAQQDKNEGFFEQETPRIMEINLSNNLAKKRSYDSLHRRCKIYS